MSDQSKRFVLAAVLFGALASAQGADTLRTVDEADIQRDWTPVNLVKPVYPREAAGQARDVCINLGYLINKEGKTSDFIVVRSWSSDQPEAEYTMEALGPFAQSAAAAVALWRFEPAPKASINRAMFTSTAIAFPGNPGADTGALRGRCQVRDLRAFVAQAQAEVGRRGDSERAKLETAYRRMNSISEAPPKGK